MRRASQSPLSCTNVLVVIHYHLRPGGVRRVVDLALPHLVAHAPTPLERVILLTGQDDAEWSNRLRQAIHPTPLEIREESALDYSDSSPYPRSVRRKKIRGSLAALPAASVVWAHNLALARNLELSEELAKMSDSGRFCFLSHHHDLWFDNRWQRWSNQTDPLTSIAKACFPAKAAHLTINQRDFQIAKKHLHHHAAYLPNPADPGHLPRDSDIRAARRWLNDQLETKGPIHILPSRLLRRKNIAEAMLLSSWLHPDATFFTTAGVSSKDEAAYAHSLQELCRKQKLRCRLSLLANSPRPPEILATIAAADAVLFTSIQEGFGLPYLEAAALGKPLIGRRLDYIIRDLAPLGFCFPQLYDELWIAAELIHWKKEQKRQEQLWLRWRNQLPLRLRKHAQPPQLVVSGPKLSKVAFSKLTLRGQIEVLEQPAQISKEASLSHNTSSSFSSALQPLHWPQGASTALSGETYAKNFWLTLDHAKKPLKAFQPDRLMKDWTLLLLQEEFLFPLLFET